MQRFMKQNDYIRGDKVAMKKSLRKRILVIGGCLVAVIGSAGIVWGIQQVDLGPSVVYAKDEQGQYVPWMKMSGQATHPLWEDYFTQTLKQDIRGGNDLAQGGYQIYSTIDLEVQRKLDLMFADFTVFANTRQIEGMSAVMVVLDPENNIVAMSSRGQTEVNPFFKSYKIGSTIKPLAIYSLAIEEDLIHYSIPIFDEPSVIKQGDQNVLWPRNNKDMHYGMVTIEKAVKRSLNTIPVKLGIQLTPEKSYEFLQDKLMFSTLTPNDNSLSALCLGEFEQGIQLQELAGAFQMFVNEGAYTRTRSYTHIENTKGDVIQDNTQVATQVIGKDTATIMNRLLYQVVEGEGGTGVAAKMEAMPVIGKTGTSDQGKDYLFVGATPYYTSVLWLGYEQPEERVPRYNYKVTEIWHTIMEELHEGLEPTDFRLDPQVAELTFCKVSGLLAGPTCERVGRGYYKEELVLELCNIH